MTFQVALVGNDGIVIGSDRKMASLPDLVGEEEGFTQTSTQSKFVTSDDRQLVCACSGGVTAWDIAKQIRNEYRAYSDETKWEEYLDGICKSKQMSPWRDRLLVARADMPTMVVWMKIGGRATLMDKVCSGAYLSASFFVSQFFDPAASVKSLTRLALLTLDCGAIEAPERVGYGYELMTLREGKWSKSTYAPGHPVIAEIREQFQGKLKDIIYPINSRIVQM